MEGVERAFVGGASGRGVGNETDGGSGEDQASDFSTASGWLWPLDGDIRCTNDSVRNHS